MAGIKAFMGVSLQNNIFDNTKGPQFLNCKLIKFSWEKSRQQNVKFSKHSINVILNKQHQCLKQIMC